MTETKRNIYLCGFMATGKSSVGKSLAAALGFEFVDMDALIEAEENTTIAEIFASRGEPAFRAMESSMIERLAKRSACVVATGGGAIVNPKNLDTMKRSGVVVTLSADVPTILRRVGDDDTRPLLRAADKGERIRALMEQRAPFYAQADIVVDTTSLSIDDVVDVLVERLGGMGFTSC